MIRKQEVKSYYRDQDRFTSIECTSNQDDANVTGTRELIDAYSRPKRSDVPLDIAGPFYCLLFPDYGSIGVPGEDFAFIKVNKINIRNVNTVVADETSIFPRSGFRFFTSTKSSRLGVAHNDGVRCKINNFGGYGQLDCE